jgi:hypothetical protein
MVPMKTLLLALAALLQDVKDPQRIKAPEAVKKAEATLKESPDNQDANLVLGKYLAFAKGEWEQAIPCLAKGSDPFYQALAEKERGGAKPLEIGDAWWTGSTEIEAHLLTGATSTMKVEAKREAARLRPFFTQRAVLFYGQAWPDLTGPDKDRIRGCMQRVFQSASPVLKSASAPKEWAIDPAAKIGPTELAIHSGRKSLMMVGGKVRSTVLGQTVVLKPNAECELSGWVLSDGTDGAEDELYAPGYSTSGKLVLHPKLAVVNDQPWWKRISAKFTTPADMAKMEVHFSLTSTKGVIYLDDVSLTVDGKEVLKNGSFEQ